MELCQFRAHVITCMFPPEVVDQYFIDKHFEDSKFTFPHKKVRDLLEPKFEELLV